MPWSASDAKRHIKGLSTSAATLWAKVANGVLRSCVEGGSSQKDCEGKAVRIANWKAKGGKKESLSSEDAVIWKLIEAEMDNEVFELADGNVPDLMFSESDLIIDRKARIIRDVVLITSKSKNKRDYLPPALQDVARLADGVKIFVNHKGAFGQRDVRDLAGKVYNPRFQEDILKVVGDLHIYKHQDWLVGLAEEDPDAVGMSIIGLGKGRRGADKRYQVEAVKELHSIDIVADPAATNSLREDTEYKTVAIKALSMSLLEEVRPDIITEIRKEVKETMALEDDVKKLEEERTNLTKKLTDTQAALKKVQEEIVPLQEAQKKSEKQVLVDKLLKDSDLPEEHASEAFKTQLAGAKDEEAIKVLIADRIEVIAFATGKKKPQSKEGSGLGEKKEEKSLDEHAEDLKGEVL